jgi:hypothetical protein
MISLSMTIKTVQITPLGDRYAGTRYRPTIRIDNQNGFSPRLELFPSRDLLLPTTLSCTRNCTGIIWLGFSTFTLVWAVVFGVVFDDIENLFYGIPV